MPTASLFTQLYFADPRTYGIDLTAKQSVGQSSLLAGEYNNSTVRIGTQSLSLGTAFLF